jgi:protein-S-isoprenylcysteine O-methyltransferase Ste14
MVSQNRTLHIPVNLARTLQRPLGIDLSAWVSGGSFLVGLWIVGFARLADGGNWLLWLAAAWIVFLLVVVVLQKAMRVSISAADFGPPKRLVTSGIFRWSRNPIYVAFLLTLLPLAIFSIVATSMAILLYWAAMNYLVMPNEERKLREAFGAEYEAYCASTPRWF